LLVAWGWSVYSAPINLTGRPAAMRVDIWLHPLQVLLAFYYIFLPAASPD